MAHLVEDETEGDPGWRRRGEADREKGTADGTDGADGKLGKGQEDAWMVWSEVDLHGQALTDTDGH